MLRYLFLSLLLCSASFPVAAESSLSSAAGDPAGESSVHAVATDVTPPTPPVDSARSTTDAAQDEADADYALLYGSPDDQQDPYNPVADDTLPAPAHISEIWDPWEKYNRKIHSFNKALDETFAKPVAKAYVRVVPRVARLGVNNFFNNLRLPISAVNSLLQGKPGGAARNVARFAINSTLGLGGIVDAAADANITERSEDFGQTMGTWGWQRSRYVELPFFGPRTIRDTLGMAVDAPMSPVRSVNDQYIRLGLQGLSLIDVRAELLSLDNLTEGVEDDYTLMRDAWSRRRMYQINSDRRRSHEEQQLPDYLDDDSNPQTPADVIPVIQP